MPNSVLILQHLLATQVTQSFVRDTSTQAAGSSDSSSEIRAVEKGKVVNWDAYEAILDDILYSKVGAVRCTDGILSECSLSPTWTFSSLLLRSYRC